MASVSDGWTGTPSTGTSRRRAASAAPGQAAAFGYVPDEQRKKQTGVDPGGGGYVSGQVAPAGAPPAYGQARPGETQRSNYQVGPYQAAPSVAPPAAAPSADPLAPFTQKATSFFNPNGGTTTTRSPLTTGTPSATPPPTSGGFGVGRAPVGAFGTTTVTSPLTSEEKSKQQTIDNTNKLNMANPINWIIPSRADTSAGTEAQARAFGVQDNIDLERFNYRPGEAAAQDVVALDKAQAEQIRALQEDALGRLGAAARGEVPSAAELQMREEAGRNVAATLGQARALGGRSAGGAARAGTMASADILSRNSTAGAALRAAEQDRARQAEIAALGGVRGQDVDTASRDAQLRQDAYSNNLRSQLEQNELAERHRIALLDAQLRALGIGAGAANGIMAANAAQAAADNKFKGGMLDTVGSIFGGA